MAESTRPGVAGVRCYNASPELKERKVQHCMSRTITAISIPILYDQNHDLYVTGITVQWLISSNGNTPVDVGVSGDTEALVQDYTLASTKVAGDVEQLTLRTTNARTIGNAAGFYRLPKQTALLATFGGSNNGQVAFSVTYVPIDKTIG